MRYRILMFALAGFFSAAGISHAQLPGQLLPGNPPNPPQSLAEPPEPPVGTRETYVQVQVPSPVQAGYLVLYEPGAANPADPQNWSDVVIFASSQFPACVSGDPAIYALLVSGSPDETGLSNADLAQVGITTNQIIACGAFTVYQAEGTRADGLNVYSPDASSVYNIYSDAESPTPTRGTSWGRIKMIYR